MIYDFMIYHFMILWSYDVWFMIFLFIIYDLWSYDLSFCDFLVIMMFPSLFGGFAWGITLADGGRGLRNLPPESRDAEKLHFSSRNRSPLELSTSHLAQIRQTNVAKLVVTTILAPDLIFEPF